MKNQEAPRSLTRLIVNLSNDPDIQLESEIQAVRKLLAVEDPSIAPQRERVLQAIQIVLNNNLVATSQSTPHEVMEDMKNRVTAAVQIGKNMVGQVQETAADLAAGLSDFFVTIPALPMRAGSSTKPLIKLRIPSLELQITFRLKDACGERSFARVVSLIDGEISHVLDGGSIIVGGNVIGRFAEGHAEFSAGVLTGQVCLRDPQGKPVEVLVIK